MAITDGVLLEPEEGQATEVIVHGICLSSTRARIQRCSGYIGHITLFSILMLLTADLFDSVKVLVHTTKVQKDISRH